MDKNVKQQTEKSKKKRDLRSTRPSKRRLIQLYAALLYNAHLKGFIEGEIYVGKTKVLCVPGFNCYSCPGAVGSCPLGALQNALAATGKTAGFYVFGIILLYGLVFGRTICGWLCPLGLIQELLHKIPTFKIPKGRVTRALSYLKYIILAVFVIAIPIWYGLWHDMAIPGFCKYICPAGTLEGATALIANAKNGDYYGMLGILFTRKFVIMLIIGLACIFCYRAFCRFLCPLGAIYGLFNKISVLGVKVDKNRCNGCGKCVNHCSMDVRRVGDHECINCGKCMEVCSQDAISIKAGKITLIAPEAGCADDRPDSAKKRKIAQNIAGGIALAVLVFALVWFNFIDPDAAKNTEVPAPDAASVTEEITVGFNEGQYLQDFTITTIDGEEFVLSQNRDKVVIINLWGTYCGPCVQELPYFDALYRKHPDDLRILAVHSSIITDDIPAFLSDKGWTIDFAADTEDDLVWKIVNGTSAMPQTIVLDRSGKVVYNQHGSVTPELLETLYQRADGAEQTKE